MIAGPGTSAGAAQNLAWIQYINNNTAHSEWPAVNHFKVGNEVWGCGGNQTEATYEPIKQELKRNADDLLDLLDNIHRRLVTTYDNYVHAERTVKGNLDNLHTNG